MAAFPGTCLSRAVEEDRLGVEQPVDAILLNDPPMSAGDADHRD